MTFRVLHHNNCFDGACSAAVFTRFHRECFGTADSYEYQGLAHAPAGELPESIFGPGENAIVDFKYSRSPRLTWWFDHHSSAFLNPELRAIFDAGQQGPQRDRQFLDQTAVSCTGWIARVARDRFGWDANGLDELLYWADIVDGALYESARAAVEMQEPAMKLTLVIESADSPEFIPRLIPLLTTMSLGELVAMPFVAERIAPQLEAHQAQIALVRERAQLEAGTIFMDLTDRPIEGMSKFIPYYLLPESVYTVSVTRSATKTKVSVGTNPWTTRPAETLVNIGELCQRLGGGGHARVGAISFHPQDLQRAVEVATEVAAGLRAGQR